MDTEPIETIRQYIQKHTMLYSQRAIHQMLLDAGYNEADIQEAFKREAKRLESIKSEQQAISRTQILLALFFLIAVVFFCHSLFGYGACRYG